MILHTQHGAVQIADDGGAPVFLLPAPLRFTSSVDDLTAYMDKEVTPEGAIRIGMAHGSIQGFGSDGEASNYVAQGARALASPILPWATGTGRCGSMTGAGTVGRQSPINSSFRPVPYLRIATAARRFSSK